MAVAYDVQQEPVPVLIEIETNQPRIECTRCEETEIEAQFWGEGDAGWAILAECSSCRSWRAALVAAGLRGTPPEREYAPEYTAHRVGADVVCDTCGSTCYRDITIVKARGHPSAYVVEIVCWLGSHIVSSRMVTGSPVRGRFPTSDVALTEWLARKKQRDRDRRMSQVEFQQVKRRRQALVTELPADMPVPERMYDGRKPVSMRRVVNLNGRDVLGCDERCRKFRFIDPEDVDGPVYTQIMHHPEPHNEYGSAEPTRAVYSWDGLDVDFEKATMHVGGELAVGTAFPTPTEWKILRVLAQSAGQVISQSKLLSLVWGPEFIDEAHLLRVNMARLRKKLDPNDSDRYVKTRAGIGYLMVEARDGVPA